jgi:CubicO group peptidase (beta-lactamase class C family)
MRVAGLALLILAGAVLGGCQKDIVACDAQGCISEAKFVDGVVKALQASPGVVGYVVYVGGMPPVFAGCAVLTPSAAVLPDDVTNIASVSKMLTTFAVLQSLSNHNISLDASIFPYLYSDWQGVANSLTFRQLLEHRSGYPVYGTRPPTIFLA